jgi:hypothetical protein
MAERLSDRQVRHFREQGWLAPLRAMDAAHCTARIADCFDLDPAYNAMRVVQYRDGEIRQAAEA